MLWKLMTKIRNVEMFCDLGLDFLTGEDVNCGGPGEESTELKLVV